jgi:hypothetical protein
MCSCHKPTAFNCGYGVVVLSHTGCVLYELASLRRAFDGGSLPALVVKILRGRYPPLPGRYSAQLRGLVDALLQQDPQVRRCAFKTPLIYRGSALVATWTLYCSRMLWCTA